MKKKLLILLILLSVSGFAQFSKTHYIPPLSSSGTPDFFPEEQFLYISTPNVDPINFRILNIGGDIVNGTVSRDLPYIYNIGVGDNTQLNVRRNNTGLVMSNKGFVVEADDLIYVTARVIAGNSNQAGEIVSKGLAALGTEFRIGAFTNTAAQSYDELHYTFISILATENNTMVGFSDIDEGVEIINADFSGSTPPPVMLNAGESYVIAVEGPLNQNRDGLIGTLVSSDKPIAVNCGSFAGTNGQLNNIDLGFDQIVSAERTGTDYIFIKSSGMPEVERVLIVAHEDNTEVFLNGSPIPNTVLNAGDYFSYAGNSYPANGNLFVHTSKNVFAYQSIGDGSQANQANQELFFVPPLSCETPRIIDNIPSLNMIGPNEFTGRVTLITETGAGVDIRVDGVTFSVNSPPSGISVQGPIPVTGNSDYETYVITGLAGNVAVYSTGQLYLASYGSLSYATFGGFYSGFTFKPEIAFDQLDLSLPKCLPNINLSVSPLMAYDVYQWYFNNVAIAGATTNSYTPTQPGYYHVSATISACGTTKVSDKIPVSSCATNVDGDLANDNIDVDNDNDGIANCTESYGSQPVPLTNPLAGVVSLGAYSNSFTGSFPPSTGTPATVPFSGSANGQLVSATSPGKGNSMIYRMDFASPISIGLEYVQSAAATDLLSSTGEYSVSVPVTKTITVLNPDDQLLIDTNYDGIYESGISQFSSFEIRFRLNGAVPLAAGTGTFKFQAYLVDMFTFTHRNLLDESPSRTTFRLLATCLPKDSDADGVFDQLDFDSDNDGIPDLTESQGSGFAALENADSNSDGLDNIFAAGISPADTDNDTIADYLDLDSDNDGIFDIVESGSNAADANNNGIIDGSAAAFGSNGLYNAIETSPGSGVLNYTLTNTDLDDSINAIESDSDNDLCNDVREAGFSDPDNDGYLGNQPVNVNSAGVVTGSGGYTAPNPEYLNPTVIEITQQPVDFTACELSNAVFTVEVTPGTTFQWQVSNGGPFTNIIDGVLYSGSATNELQIVNANESMDGYIYRVVINRVGNICGLISAQATLNLQSRPEIVTRTLVQCETGTPSDGLSLFNLSQAASLLTLNDPNLQIEYFLSISDADNNLNPLPLDYTNISNPEQIIAKITDLSTGCSSNSFLILSVNTTANQNLSIPEQCDTDGIEDGLFAFDLTSANVIASPGQPISYFVSEQDALLEQNAIADPANFENTTPYAEQIVFARVENPQGCSRIARIRIKVNPLPDINVNAGLDNFVVCVNTPTFTAVLDADFQDGSNPADYNYQWYFEGNAIPGATNPTLTVSTEGLYTVDVTDVNGCSKTRFIPVISSSSAIIESIDITDMSNNNTVTVNITSNSFGDYVYSLDHMNAYQQSNVFYNVPAGIHTVYVNDLNGCPIASEVIAVTGIPVFFTPNGDGFNDTWNVKGISERFNANSVVYIFDRYGKLLKQIGARGEGWDGTVNGEPMPSDDYWYVVKLDDGRNAKGHFALKR